MAARVQQLARQWLASLAHERRLSPHTLRAYGDDVQRFLDFLASYRGSEVTLAILQGLRPADVRAFLTARRGEGLGARGIQRALAALR
jgi:integrase/recombinase XerC